MTIAGKSKSQTNFNGIRRQINGNDLAPKSLRGKIRWLKDCSDEQLKKANINR
jgi:hypothetical protein